MLKDDLDDIVTACVEPNIDFELLLIDAESLMIDSHINTIVNQYIADSKKANRPLVVTYKAVKEFAENFMKYTNSVPTGLPTDKIDIIAPNKRCFGAELPQGILSREKVDDLMHLGPDHVPGNLPDDVLFDYVLSPFYLFLFKNDLLNNDEYGNLVNYQFGMH